MNAVSGRGKGGFTAKQNGMTQQKDTRESDSKHEFILRRMIILTNYIRKTHLPTDLTVELTITI